MMAQDSGNQPHQPDGWPKLLEGYPWFEGKGHYPINAYSEFMPPPRLGRSPYGESDPLLIPEADSYGWNVSEIEEEYEIKPGLEDIGRHVMKHLLNLGQGKPEYHIAGHKGSNLVDNAYWPAELAAHAGNLAHDRYVVFLPLALSKTQDDKGRVRWTFFGGSEQGPERAFWKSFYTAPGQELGSAPALAFFSSLLQKVYAENVTSLTELYSLGFRILPTAESLEDSPTGGRLLPAWTQNFLIDEGASFEEARYLLTFRPFSLLPAPVKERYLAGKLVLLPFPGSLVFWGMPTYQRLQTKLHTALQIPMLSMVARHRMPGGIRVPQSGWLHEPRQGMPDSEIQPELLNHHFTRTHRWDRVHRYEDELTLNPHVEKVAKVIFDTALDVIGLYDKPMARNSQLWTEDFELFLDGPNATASQVKKAEAEFVQGGLFGYRFLFPPMRVGKYEVYWHRPLVAYLSPTTSEIELLPDAPAGYLTAYLAADPDLARPIELWPRLLRRPQYLSALSSFHSVHDYYTLQTTLNLDNLFDCWQMLGKQPLPRSFARDLLRISKHETLESWIASLPELASNPEAGRRMQAEVESILEPPTQPLPQLEAYTYNDTANRAFEEAYWNDILFLAHGRFVNKDNADVVEDEHTLSHATHLDRDLEQLGDYLISRHRQAIRAAGMEGKAFCGDLPFKWQTDFDFAQFGGWKKNNDREGGAHERNILVVIPGKDRSQAVVMADHYDTAYMEDLFDTGRGGSGARLAAAGADDNHSATTALLQAAPIFLKLAQQGKLERDVWLLHLTGEEFPSDCMGARSFCQSLVEKTLRLHLDDDQFIDLSAVRVEGVFVLDMIAHNRDNDPDIFQISPGKSAKSLRLAFQAHLASEAWKSGVKEWNKSPERHGLGRGKRSQDGKTIPPVASFLSLDDEVRTMDDPQSSLYNTDGQIFSDIGAPVVLFMENYDINRSGYHDTKDTMENIDLDYGAALAAIAIESVARVAAQP